MKKVFTTTDDQLVLPGIHYEAGKKDLCLLFVHGMGGSYESNYFVDEVGASLNSLGIGCLYTHNRGYSYINNLADVSQPHKEGSGFKTKMYGMVYERLDECRLDISAWIDKTLELGYRKVVLMGHSLGATKVMYFLHRDNRDEVEGVVLASQGDMVGLVKIPEYEPHYDELIAESEKLMKEGQPRKLLSRKVWGEHRISAQTFLDMFVEGGPGDNLPVLRNPNNFVELGSIKVPILCTMGEFDDIVIRSIPEDMELIRSKAKGTDKFTGKIIANAHHNYMSEDKQVAQIITDWIKGL